MAFHNSKRNEAHQFMEIVEFFRTFGMNYLDFMFFKSNTELPKFYKPFLNKLDRELKVGEL